MSDRAVLQRISEELERDERWRVIVRGNNWLCPYCLQIGARELRLDEDISSKIAEHLLQGGCPRWNGFQSEPHPVDRLRQTARYLVFKTRVLRWLGEDRRFRLLDGAGRWLCPYCAELTDVTVANPAMLDLSQSRHPEEEPLLKAVVGHLLRCQSFGQGDERARPLQELEELLRRPSGRPQLAELLRRFEREPAFRLVDAEKRWLCPFCATTQDVLLPDERPDGRFLRGMAEHLEQCKAHTVLGGRPRPVDELKARVVADTRARQLQRIRHKAAKHSIWRVHDLTGAWYCPYCSNATRVPFPERDGGLDPAEEETFFGAVLDHLTVCDDYRQPGAHVRSKAEMAQAVQAANVRIERHRRVRKALVEDPLFGVTDELSNWVCPHCRKIQKQILLPGVRESVAFEKTVDQVADHLYAGCEGHQEGVPPRATRAELEEVARQTSRRASGIRESGSGVRRVTESFDEQSWMRMQDDLRVVRSRVERAKQLGSSLREARTKQLRLLPEVPELPGFEFARIYKPCDAVGGDFYAFFPAADGVQALAIGDISGHGIEAALLMGLAKKLLEVHGRGRTSPAQTLCLANRDIFSDLDDRTFVTVFYGLLDTRSRRFKFSRAGHDPVILFNPRRSPPLQPLDSKGMALGMDDGTLFEQSIEELEIALQPGDLVLQYTDGVTETMNEKNEQFGHDRLYAVIQEHGQSEAEYVLWKIEKATEAFRGSRRRSDDMTMIAFKVLE